MNLPSDDETIVSTGETLREAKARGGRNKGKPSLEAISRKANRNKEKERNDRVRAFTLWQTGNYTKRQLALALGVHYDTLKSWAKRDEWPERPLSAAVAEILPGVVASESGETNEEVLAAASGRRPDQEQVQKERANAQAKRKSQVLARNRLLADRYHLLAMKTMDLLTDYANGTLVRSVVKTVDEQGKPIFTPFYLISKTHGFADGVYRLGMIAEKSIKLDRAAHALEGVDGDGNPLKLGKGKLADPLATKLTSELEADLQNLLAAIQAPGRVTEKPSGLLPMVLDAAPAVSPSIPVVPPGPLSEQLAPFIPAMLPPAAEDPPSPQRAETRPPEQDPAHAFDPLTDFTDGA